MYGRSRKNREDYIANAPPREQWPAQPPAEHVAPEKREEYLSRCAGVDAWMEGKCESAIIKCSGLTAREARRLFERCTSINTSTGRVLGYAACIPRTRRNDGTRTRMRAFDASKAQEGQGLCGALTDLFRRRPEIEAAMIEFATTRKVEEGVPASVITNGKLHAYFLKLCRKYINVREGQYPFNTKRLGYKAICAWYDNRRYQHPVTAARNEAGDSAAQDTAAANFAIGRAVAKPRPLAYERTELDEHHLDAMFTIHVLTAKRELKPISTRRFWALALLETSVDAVLASTLAIGLRYNKGDVLRLVRNAFLPPTRRVLRFKNSEWDYKEGAAYPGEVDPFKKNTWHSLAYDADASHIAPQSLSAIGEVAKCEILNERVGHFGARRPVERFFRRLAGAASWLPSATGNRPDSPSRRDPQTAAVRWHIDFCLAEDLIDVLGRNHNVTPNATNGGLTPLQALHERVLRGQIYLNQLGAFGDANIWKLLPCYPARINRVLSNGRLGPMYIELFGARYSSVAMAYNPEIARMDDKTVYLYVEEDARSAYAVRGDGKDVIGKVAVAQQFADVPHTLNMRRAYIQFINEQRAHGNAHGPHTMLGFLQMVGEVAQSDEKAAVFYAEQISFMRKYEQGQAWPIEGTVTELEDALNATSKLDVDDEVTDALPDVWLPPAAHIEQTVAAKRPAAGKRDGVADAGGTVL